LGRSKLRKKNQGNHPRAPQKKKKSGGEKGRVAAGQAFIPFLHKSHPRTKKREKRKCASRNDSALLCHLALTIQHNRYAKGRGKRGGQK